MTADGNKRPLGYSITFVSNRPAPRQSSGGLVAGGELAAGGGDVLAARAADE